MKHIKSIKKIPTNTRPRSNTSSKTSQNKVRIIGGQLKRRYIPFIDTDGLRPTSDRLRETIFNWLMGDLVNASVLDVCAGSGVLGFECLSRGANHAVLIEKNPKQASLLTQTAQTLGVSNKTQIVCQDCLTAIDLLKTAFDIVFIDPPYALNLWTQILEKLLNNQTLKKGTLIYLESDKTLDDILIHTNPNLIAKLQLIKTTKVGQVFAHLLQVL